MIVRLLTAVGLFGLHLSTAVADLFVILYAIYAHRRWWKSEAGRAIMAFLAVIAALLSMLSARAIFGDSTGFAIVRFLVFVIGVPAVLIWQLRLLLILLVFPVHRARRNRQRRQDS